MGNEVVIMLEPIQKDHELLCPGCGCVLRNIDESHNEKYEKSPIPPSVEVYLLGSALESNVKYSFRRTPQQGYEERVLRQLLNITKNYAIPDSIAYSTFNEMKKKNRGFRSETEPVKQLLRVLSKDENYIYIHKMRAIKARYEHNTSI